MFPCFLKDTLVVVQVCSSSLPEKNKKQEKVGLQNSNLYITSSLEYTQ